MKIGLILQDLQQNKKIPSKHSNTPRLMQWLYICQVSRQLIENKNDLIKLIKPKWPPQPRFQSHIKTDNTNRLAYHENLYIYQVSREFKKKSLKKNWSPGGGHFDFRLKAENLIRWSPYSWATSHKKLERFNNYFSSYRVNKELLN